MFLSIGQQVNKANTAPQGKATGPSVPCNVRMDGVATGGGGRASLTLSWGPWIGIRAKKGFLGEVMGWGP